MDATPWIYSLGGMASTYAKAKTRTIEMVEKEIEELKKRSDDHVDYELNDRMCAGLNHSIMWHEANIKDIEANIQALDGMDAKHKETTDWQLIYTIFQTRLASDKKIVEDHKETLAFTLQKVKEYAFVARSRDLREELEELKEEAKQEPVES